MNVTFFPFNFSVAYKHGSFYMCSVPTRQTKSLVIKLNF
jgi:hypothetical protein